MVTRALDADRHWYRGENSQLFFKDVTLVGCITAVEDVWQFLPEIVRTTHMIHDLLAEVLFHVDFLR